MLSHAYNLDSNLYQGCVNSSYVKRNNFVTISQSPEKNTQVQIHWRQKKNWNEMRLLNLLHIIDQEAIQNRMKTLPVSLTLLEFCVDAVDVFLL